MFLREVLAEGTPTYNWSFKDDERFKTLSSLVKYNNGIWKSAKQRDFLTSSRGIMGGDFKNNGHQRRDYAFLKSNFGVEADEKKDQYVIQVGGWVQWAAGKKANQPFEWMFVMDEHGVVKKYKLGFLNTGPSSKGIDKKKTKLEWERTGKIDTKELDKSAKEKATSDATREKEKAAEIAKSDYVGKPGEWIEDKKVKIEKVVDLGAGEFGQRWMTIMKDEEGNTYNYFGYPKMKGLDWDDEASPTGKQFVVRAKVKKHYVNKNGMKVTVVGYPKFGVQK